MITLILRELRQWRGEKYSKNSKRNVLERIL